MALSLLLSLQFHCSCIHPALFFLPLEFFYFSHWDQLFFLSATQNLKPSIKKERETGNFLLNLLRSAIYHLQSDMHSQSIINKVLLTGKTDICNIEANYKSAFDTSWVPILYNIYVSQRQVWKIQTRTELKWSCMLCWDQQHINDYLANSVDYIQIKKLLSSIQFSAEFLFTILFLHLNINVYFYSYLFRIVCIHKYLRIVKI